jgi:TonB-dependent starch-binding outer membrane protein SusC
MAAARPILLPLLCLFLLVLPLSAQDQPGTITGRVFDLATEQPVAGVTLTVAQRSTLTGADGRFIVVGVPAGTHEIRLVMLGYREETQSVTVAAGQTVSIAIGLTPEAIALEQLVVTGYGTRRAGDITGSVDRLGDDQFNTGRIVSPEELIQGRIAGLQVIDSGEPGGLVQIRIRGGTSVNASNEPLFVIDGVPLPSGGGLSAGRNPLNFLNPDDIESITVLKDASATAIYGSRGANGVIFVETRRGSVREPQLTYSGSFSSSSALRTPQMLSPEQYRTVVNAVAPQLIDFLGPTNTDWRDAVLRSGTGQEHSVAVAGTGDQLSYRLSLGYLGQEGIVRGSKTERLTASVVASHQLLDDRLNIRANLRGARTDDQFTPGGGLAAATIFDPTQPILTTDGYFEQRAFVLGPNNPIAELDLGLEEGVTYRSMGSLESEYLVPFVHNLTATARMGYDVASSERKAFYPSTLWSQEKGPNPGYLNRSNPRETTGLLDLFFTHRVPFATSHLETTAGYSYETSRGDYPFFEAMGLDTDLLGPSGMPVANETRTTLFESERRLASFFARANYSLHDRYLFTASVRRDGSSRFGPDNQWGTFPAAAFAWRLSEEPFLEGFDRLSDLKLRLSWGVNGNQAFDDYMWVPTYQYGDQHSQIQFGNEWVTTIRPSAVDPNIKWEETTSYNLGLDYGFNNNRIHGSVDFYVKDTDDLIFRVPVAAGTFLSNFVTTNIGSMRNVGLELALHADVLDRRADGGLGWTTSFTAATNSNELLRINPFGDEGTDRILVGGIAGGVGTTIQVLQPGYPINSFFVFQHRYGPDGRPVPDGSMLDRYEDLNGDGVINIDDRRVHRSPAPSWIFGHSSRFDYADFGLSFSMRAHLGNYVYNNLASYLGYYNRLNEAAGPVNLHASVSQNHFREQQFFSDVYIEDASFLRMDNLTLDYRLPNVRGVQQIRLFGTIQNVFTFTNYTGVDPEAGLLGIDTHIYPRSRTFTTGASVVF